MRRCGYASVRACEQVRIPVDGVAEAGVFVSHNTRKSQNLWNDCMQQTATSVASLNRVCSSRRSSSALSGSDGREDREWPPSILGEAQPHLPPSHNQFAVDPAESFRIFQNLVGT